MSSEEIVLATSGTISAQIFFDVIAVLAGIVAIYHLVCLNRKLGGRLSGALKFFNLGVLSNVLSIAWSTFADHAVYTLGAVTFDIHHVFMSLGMVFFIVSTHKFSSLVQG